MQVFLSYASEDRDAADRVRYALHAAGYEVFYDREDLPPGQEYDQTIRRQLGASGVMVFLISPASVAPGRYTQTELKLAQARWPHPSGRVLPVLLRPTPMDDVPAYLRAVGILEPSGDAAAEIAHEVVRLVESRSPWTRAVRLLRSPLGVISVIALLAAGAATWQFWPGRGIGDAVTPLHDSVRHRARFLAATAEGYAVIAGSPNQVVRFDEADRPVGEPLALPGEPVALKPFEGGLLVATRAPEGVAVVSLERWIVSDTIPLVAARVDRDPGTTVATDIVSVELVEGMPWVTTGGRDGDPAVLRMRPDREWVVATSAEGMLNPPPDFDGRGLRLRSIGVELWALAVATSPSRLYRIEWRIRVDEARGDDADLVRCADDLAEGPDRIMIFLSCENELVEFRNDGASLHLLRKSPPLAPENVPGNRTRDLIVTQGSTVFVALNTEGEPSAKRREHARIVRVAESDVEALYEERDAVVTSMAVTPRAVLAVLKRAEGTIDAVRIARGGTVPPS